MLDVDIVYLEEKSVSFYMTFRFDCFVFREGQSMLLSWLMNSNAKVCISEYVACKCESKSINWKW